MSSNYQQKKMMNALGAIDTKGNIVLEQFQDGTALLFQPGNAQPFCVATDYDRATASWSYGKYFSDLGCAYEAADPEIIEDASVRWVKEDIREKLKAQDIAPTEFNVQSVIMGDSRLCLAIREASLKIFYASNVLSIIRPRSKPSATVSLRPTSTLTNIGLIFP